MNINFYRTRKLVIVGADFHSEGGAWRSIYRYFREEEMAGQPMHLLDLARPRGFRQLLAATLFSPRLLVNGLAALQRWSVLLAVLARADALIYLHDTEDSLGDFARSHPFRMRWLRWIIRHRRMLCVSMQAEKLYRDGYQAARTVVVGECLAAEMAPDFSQGVCHVIMVGSINLRKGAVFFSQVAEEAGRRGLPFQFHWVGATATQAKLPLSSRVNWHGWQQHPRDWVRQADIFLLSSVDDPMPLAALEALALGKKTVAYSRTGTAEVIANLRGCAVFESYTAEACLEALRRVADEQLDVETLRQRLHPYSVAQFRMGISRLLS